MNKNNFVNNIFFPNIYLDFFFSGKNKSNNFIKIKSNKNISKYELKLFLLDFYNNKKKILHSNIIRKKKKKKYNSNQKKIFWLKID